MRNELVRLMRALRCDATDPRHAFRHRVGTGLAIATLIFILSLFG